MQIFFRTSKLHKKELSANYYAGFPHIFQIFLYVFHYIKKSSYLCNLIRYLF